VAFKKKSKDDDAVDVRAKHGARGGVTTVVEGNGADHALDESVLSPAPGTPGTNGTSNSEASQKQNLRLGDQLIASNLITEAQLTKALEMQLEGSRKRNVDSGEPEIVADDAPSCRSSTAS
jgi:hypothetical protein